MSEVTVKNFDELIKALSKNKIPVKETITQWEYATTPVETNPPTPPEQFQTRLTKIGKDGWEAVCMLPTGLILLKRPLV